MSITFQKRTEDFVCEHCGFEVAGNGFTNHCPKCLWAKHVDVNPGDRAASCKGLMEPVSSEFLSGEYSILHRCIQCRFERKNKVQTGDDFNALISLSNQSLK